MQMEDLRNESTWRVWVQGLGSPLHDMLASAGSYYDAEDDAIVLVFPHNLLDQAEYFLQATMVALVAFYAPRWTDFLEEKGFPNAQFAIEHSLEVEDFLMKIDCAVPAALIVPRVRAEFMPAPEHIQ
jgi:hypothetical protein